MMMQTRRMNQTMLAERERERTDPAGVTLCAHELRDERAREVCVPGGFRCFSRELEDRRHEIEQLDLLAHHVALRTARDPSDKRDALHFV